MLWLHYEWDQNYGKLIKNALSPAKVQKGKTVTRCYNNKSKLRGQGRTAPGVSGPFPLSQISKNCAMAIAVSLIVTGFWAGTRSPPGAYSSMTDKPKFHSKMIKNGRWTIVVTARHGPESRVGDFATEEEAQRWISTKSKDWSPPMNDSK